MNATPYVHVEYFGGGRGRGWSFRTLRIWRLTLHVSRKPLRLSFTTDTAQPFDKARAALFKKYGVYRWAFKRLAPDFVAPPAWVRNERS